jgi:hypothetical protein
VASSSSLATASSARAVAASIARSAALAPGDRGTVRHQAAAGNHERRPSASTTAPSCSVRLRHPAQIARGRPSPGQAPTHSGRSSPVQVWPSRVSHVRPSSVRSPTGPAGSQVSVAWSRRSSGTSARNDGGAAGGGPPAASTRPFPAADHPFSPSQWNPSSSGHCRSPRRNTPPPTNTPPPASGSAGYTCSPYWLKLTSNQSFGAVDHEATSSPSPVSHPASRAPSSHRTHIRRCPLGAVRSSATRSSAGPSAIARRPDATTTHGQPPPTSTSSPPSSATAASNAGHHRSSSTPPCSDPASASPRSNVAADGTLATTSENASCSSSARQSAATGNGPSSTALHHPVRASWRASNNTGLAFAAAENTGSDSRCRTWCHNVSLWSPAPSAARGRGRGSDGRPNDAGTGCPDAQPRRVRSHPSARVVGSPSSTSRSRVSASNQGRSTVTGVPGRASAHHRTSVRAGP